MSFFYADIQSMKMKTLKNIAAAGLLFACLCAHAEKPVQEEKDLYEYNNIVSKLTKPLPPFSGDNYIVFTQPMGHRFIGIAFDFEEYRTIHPFMIHRNRDVEGSVTSELMFYILERPAELSEITYRLVIDGLWTSDPMNTDKIYDEFSGITLSKLDLGGRLPEVTGQTKNSGTKFIYNGEPGLTVRLGGTFTNWDSWIYQLEETSPGFYELSIPLPCGKYYYNYYLGMNAVVDKTNPERAYTQDGRTASVITVQ